MKALFICLIYLIIYSTASAQEAPKLITVNFKEISGLNETELSLIRKSSIEAIVAGNKKFQLSLSRLDPKKMEQSKAWYEFIAVVSKSNQFESQVKFLLVERPAGQLINRVQENAVQNVKLQYRARILALKLLFGKNVDEVTGQLITPEIIPLDQYIDAERNEVPPLEKIQEPKVVYPDLNLPAVVEHTLEQGPAAVAPAIPLNSSKAAKPDDPRPGKAKERHHEIFDKKFPDVISDFESPDLNLQKLPYKPESSKPSLYKTNFSYTLGFEKEIIDTNIIFSSNEAVVLETNLDRLLFKFIMNHFDKGNGNYFYFTGGLSKNIGENEHGITPKFLISGDFNYDLYNERLLAGPVVEFERNGYANLRNRGEGLFAVSSNILWAGLSFRSFFTYKESTIKIFAAIKKSFIANSDIGPNGDALMIEGEKMQLSLGTKFYGAWGAELNVEKSEITSVAARLDNKHFASALNVVYN